MNILNDLNNDLVNKNNELERLIAKRELFEKIPFMSKSISLKLKKKERKVLDDILCLEVICRELNEEKNH